VPFPFVDTASYPVRKTDALKLYVDGQEAFAAIADAIEGAKSYVYITVAYGSLNFQLKPPDGEQLRDLLIRTAKRGVRTAVLSWLPDAKVDDTVPLSVAPDLADNKVLARWDKAKCSGIYEPFPQLACHHQKTFVIDGTLAFVGGINIVQSYWDTQAHSQDDDRRVTYDLTDVGQRALLAQAPATLPLHDIFTSFTGPAVADVEANFVQRWNGASEKNSAPILTPNPVGQSPDAGLQIQIVRTIAPGTYLDLPNGETSIRKAMLGLINGAQSSIYFENQYFFDDDVVSALRAAGERGVRVVGLICRAPDAGQAVGVLEAFLDEESESQLQWTWFNPALRKRIQLYSPVTNTSPSKDIYVHCKTMVGDDQYILTGSANIAFTSLDFHSEMCVLADDAPTAASLRRLLWCEHLCLRDDQLPDSFEDGADLWASAAKQNFLLRSQGQPPLSRVIAIRSEELSMAGPATSPVRTADMMVNIFDGTRQLMRPGVQVLYRIIDGNQRQIVAKSAGQPSLFAEKLPFYDNFGDNYTVIASADDYYQTGFSPVKVSQGVLATVGLMLLPKKSRFNFSDASWIALQQTHPAVFNLLLAGASANNAQARYEDLMAKRPLSLASFFNLTTAMEQIHLPVGTPLDYLKQIKWDDSFEQDRFFCYADKDLVNQVKLAAEQGIFAPEMGSGFFHPGATCSYKQVQFGEANVQLTFHEGDIATIGSTECVCVEPDIDYYKDLAAHALLEVLTNKLTGGLTDPRTVYALRWIAGRHAGVPEFKPPYTIEPAS
jgi:phosphatidylserine/phosphatidylglycerophosphate/cardiolipin synthase-like enzyme